MAALVLPLTGCGDDDLLEKAEECRRHDGDQTCGGASGCQSMLAASSIHCGLECDPFASDPGCPAGYTCTGGASAGETTQQVSVCIEDESLPL